MSDDQERAQLARQTLFEVRCCCRPDKLLGYVRVSPFTHVASGQDVLFALRPERPAVAWADAVPLRVPSVRLTFLAWGREEHGRVVEGGYAFKADGLALETLRRIEGWQDA